jgi:hypothetical protein
MAKQLQLRRGTTAQHTTDKGDGSGFTGVVGEITVDTSENTIIIHSGASVTSPGGQTRCKLEIKGQIHPFMKSSTHQSMVLGY